MTTLATLQTQLANLREVRASGRRSVAYQNGRVEFRSDEELAAAIADIERRIAALQGGRPHTIVVYTSKGL